MRVEKCANRWTDIECMCGTSQTNRLMTRSSCQDYYRQTGKERGLRTTRLWNHDQLCDVFHSNRYTNTNAYTFSKWWAHADVFMPSATNGNTIRLQRRVTRVSLISHFPKVVEIIAHLFPTYAARVALCRVGGWVSWLCGFRLRQWRDEHPANGRRQRMDGQTNERTNVTISQERRMWCTRSNRFAFINRLASCI